MFSLSAKNNLLAKIPAATGQPLFAPNAGNAKYCVGEVGTSSIFKNEE